MQRTGVLPCEKEGHEASRDADSDIVDSFADYRPPVTRRKAMPELTDSLDADSPSFDRPSLYTPAPDVGNGDSNEETCRSAEGDSQEDGDRDSSFEKTDIDEAGSREETAEEMPAEGSSQSHRETAAHKRMLPAKHEPLWKCDKCRFNSPLPPPVKNRSCNSCKMSFHQTFELCTHLEKKHGRKITALKRAMVCDLCEGSKPFTNTHPVPLCEHRSRVHGVCEMHVVCGHDGCNILLPHDQVEGTSLPAGHQCRKFTGADADDDAVLAKRSRFDRPPPQKGNHSSGNQSSAQWNNYRSKAPMRRVAVPWVDHNAEEYQGHQVGFAQHRADDRRRVLNGRINSDPLVSSPVVTPHDPIIRANSGIPNTMMSRLGDQQSFPSDFDARDPGIRAGAGIPNRMVSRVGDQRSLSSECSDSALNASVPDTYPFRDVDSTNSYRSHARPLLPVAAPLPATRGGMQRPSESHSRQPYNGAAYNQRPGRPYDTHRQNGETSQRPPWQQPSRTRNGAPGSFSPQGSLPFNPQSQHAAPQPGRRETGGLLFQCTQCTFYSTVPPPRKSCNFCKLSFHQTVELCNHLIVEHRKVIQPLKKPMTCDVCVSLSQPPFESHDPVKFCQHRQIQHNYCQMHLMCGRSDCSVLLPNKAALDKHITHRECRRIPAQ